MLEVLNKNPGAIQGLSTVALVCITAVYVFLTWNVANAATAEQRALREAAEARKRPLGTNVRHLREIVGMLPGPTTNPSAMTTTLQNFPPENWNDFDFNQLRELASEISDEAGRSASIVETNMKLLARELERILEPESMRSIDWD